MPANPFVSEDDLKKLGFFVFLELDEKAAYERVVREGLPPFLEKEADPAEAFSLLYFKRLVFYRHFSECTVALEPADDIETGAALEAAYEYEGPVYIRFGRAAVPVIHEEGMNFQIGKGEVLKDGSDVAIIANGLMVNEALVAAEELREAGINAMVINMATIKPLDEELVLAAAKKCGKIITCEEHSVIGGLGEAVCSCLAEKCPTLVRRIGVNDEFGHSGPAAALLKQFGLSAEHIVEVAKDLCK